MCTAPDVYKLYPIRYDGGGFWMEAGGFNAAQCRAAQFTLAELKAGGFNAAQCRAAGFTPCPSCTANPGYNGTWVPGFNASYPYGAMCGACDYGSMAEGSGEWPSMVVGEAPGSGLQGW